MILKNPRVSTGFFSAVRIMIETFLVCQVTFFFEKSEFCTCRRNGNIFEHKAIRTLRELQIPIAEKMQSACRKNCTRKSYLKESCRSRMPKNRKIAIKCRRTLSNSCKPIAGFPPLISAYLQLNGNFFLQSVTATRVNGHYGTKILKTLLKPYRVISVRRY